MGPYIGKAKASRPCEGFIPNPKLKLLDKVSEVMRFKHYSLRTERTYREWIKRYMGKVVWHGYAVDGVRAVAGQGRGFRTEPGCGARGKGFQRPGDGAAWGRKGAFGGAPEASPSIPNWLGQVTLAAHRPDSRRGDEIPVLTFGAGTALRDKHEDS